jgi:hypothetical protein
LGQNRRDRIQAVSLHKIKRWPAALSDVMASTYTGFIVMSSYSRVIEALRLSPAQRWCRQRALVFFISRLTAIRASRCSSLLLV